MKLHFRKIGEGQALIILHGLFGYSDNWQTLGRRFAEDFTVYLVDLRNHGHSPHSEEFSYALMADDLAQLCEQEGIDDAIVLGHSMGGKVAMHFAQHHPHFMDKLIVADMGVRQYESHHDKILEGLNAIDLTVVKSRGEATKILSQHIEERGIQQFLLKNLYWIEKGQLAWRINLPVLQREMPEILSALPNESVHLPTLFLRGGNSNYITEDDEFELQQVFPLSILITVPDAGHWLHAEQPDLFYDEVMDFV